MNELACEINADKVDECPAVVKVVKDGVVHEQLSTSDVGVLSSQANERREMAPHSELDGADRGSEVYGICVKCQ